MELGIEEVRRWVQNHRRNIIEDMRQIVNIRSVSEPDTDIPPFGAGCRKVLETMLALAGEKGMETENYEGYGGRMCFSSGTKAKEVGIWAHLDVVPEGEDWTFPPYEMAVCDDFLIGRGVQDNKSSAVGILYALCCLKELSIPLTWQYSLFVGCSEENTMDDVAYLTNHVKMPDLSLVADCGFPVCYGEKGNLSLEFMMPVTLPEEILLMEAGTSENSVPDRARFVCRRGTFTEQQIEKLQVFPGIRVLVQEEKIVVEAQGRAAHIINPEQGNNAVTCLAAALLGCESEVKNRGFKELKTCLQFLKDSGRDGYGSGIGIEEEDLISGSLTGCITGLSTMERKLCITANYRYPVLNRQGERSDGRDLIERLIEAASGYGLVMRVKKNREAMYRPPADPVIECLTKSYQTHSGYNNPAYTMSGGTYAGKLPNGIGFGMSLPGKKVYRPDPARPVGDFHQADESICISQLLDAIAVYVMCLIDLDKNLNHLIKTGGTYDKERTVNESISE